MVRNTLAHVDANALGDLEEYLSPDVEVVLSSSSPRLDSLDSFGSCLRLQQEVTRDQRTALWRPSVRVFGEAAVAGFHFRQDWVALNDGPSERAGAIPPRKTRLGRRTMVLTRSGNGWHAETIHLSEFSE